MSDGLLRFFIITMFLVCAKPSLSLPVDGASQHDYSKSNTGYNNYIEYGSNDNRRYGVQGNYDDANRNNQKSNFSKGSNQKSNKQQSKGGRGGSILDDSLSRVLRYGNNSFSASNSSQRNVKAYERCQSRLCSVSSSIEDVILLPVARYSVANLLTGRGGVLAYIGRSNSPYGNGGYGGSSYFDGRNNSHNGYQNGRNRVVINRGEHRRGVDSFMRRRATQVAAVPVPASAFLFASGIFMLIGFRKPKLKAKFKQSMVKASQLWSVLPLGK